jgi:hypothetical protein
MTFYGDGKEGEEDRMMGRGKEEASDNATYTSDAGLLLLSYEAPLGRKQMGVSCPWQRQ